MKDILFVLILILVSLSLNAQEFERYVKIKSIDSTETHYFIKGVFKKKPKNKILIISKRDSAFIGNEKIKLKKTYLLKLSNYLSDEEMTSIPLKPKGSILISRHDYIVWDGSRDFPYLSHNIKSLYFINR